MERHSLKIRISIVGAFVSSSVLLFACGGGSSGGTTTAALNGGTISGTVVKGPARGASVAAFAITNGTVGAQVGGGNTDSTGNFTISIGDYTGPMMLQASGGTYTDEAKGNTMTMQPGDVTSPGRAHPDAGRCVQRQGATGRQSGCPALEASRHAVRLRDLISTLDGEIQVAQQAVAELVDPAVDGERLPARARRPARWSCGRRWPPARPR